MAIGALWSRVTGAIVGFAVGQAAADATRPVFELVRQESWDGNATRVLDVGTLAHLVATAITDQGAAATQARRSGYDANKLAALVQLALNAPTIAEARDMRRREAISDAQFRHALRKAGLEPQYDEAAIDLLNVLPSVTDLIRMSVREVFDPAQRSALDLDAEYPDALTAAGKRIGLSRSTLGNYWAAHWELPSYTQLTEMLFRREITAGEFSGALKALDYAPRWRGPLEAIARRIPTITDMIRFAVREVYDPDARRGLGIDAEYPAAFTAQAALHGMSEEHAREYWAAHWRLPSARQGYQMLWRGEITAAELDQLLKALDYPPKWRGRLAAIARIVPGRVDLRRMFRADVLTRAEVKAGYVRLGYSDADAEILTQFAETEKADSAIGGRIVPLYRRRVVAAAHREFTSRQISEDVARTNVAAAGVLPETIADLMPLWRLERDLKRRELTEADIRAAFKADQYTEAEALAELAERGMTPEDAGRYLQS